MQEKLEEQLRRDFPFMRQYCDCGDGWYDLLHELCRSISDRYERDKKRADIVVVQVKEKFATLNFYYEYEGDSHPIKTPESHGGAINETTKQLRKDIAEIVCAYEEKSGSICELCGAAGEIRTDLRWSRTLCEGCCSKLGQDR